MSVYVRMTRIAAKASAFIVMAGLAGNALAGSPPTIAFAEAGVAWFNAPTIVARMKSYYDKQQVNISSFDVSTGLASKNAVANGNADIGVSAATPIVFAARDDDKIVVLGRYLTSDKLISLIRRKVDGVPPGDIPMPIGIVPSTASEFFLIDYLEGMGKANLYTNAELRAANFQLVGIRPTGIVQAFRAGDINSAVIWEPLASEIVMPSSGSPPKDVTADAGKGTYVFQAFLVTSHKVWAERRTDVLKVLRAIKAVCQDINGSDEARAYIENYFSYPNGWLATKWKEAQFVFNADREKIKKDLEKEADLAVSAGLLAKRPNFDKILSVLDEVKKDIGD